MYTRYCRNHQIDIIDMSEFINGYDDWKKYYFARAIQTCQRPQNCRGDHDRALAGRLGPLPIHQFRHVETDLFAC